MANYLCAFIICHKKKSKPKLYIISWVQIFYNDSALTIIKKNKLGHMLEKGIFAKTVEYVTNENSFVIFFKICNFL